MADIIKSGDKLSYYNKDKYCNFASCRVNQIGIFVPNYQAVCIAVYYDYVIWNII